MPLKDRINRAIYGATGYLLTRETPEQRQAAIQDAARRSAARTRRQADEKSRRVAAQRQQQPGKRRAHDDLARPKKRRRIEAGKAEARAAYDEEVRMTIDRARPRTMTGAPKLAALIEATRYVVHHEVPGAVVECGVWRGGSMQAVAWTLLALGETDRHLHLFDTFEGMPPPTAQDTRTTDGGSVSAEELLTKADKDSTMWAIAGLDDVRAAMAETGFPADRVHFHPGMVEETTPGQAPDTIAILRLDTDWYASTKHELEHLYARLSPGGVLILDDYGSWDGARRATDEWLAETGEPLFLAPMGAGRIAVKPGARPERRAASRPDRRPGRPA